MAQLKYLDLTGLENLVNQTISRVEQEAEDTLNFIDSQKGAANGIAGLDATQKLLSTNLPIAGTNLGAIKNGYIANNKNYAVQVLEDGTAFVNVPWETTTIEAATNTSIGGFLTGFNESGRNFAVKLSESKAYVTVPQTTLTDLGITATASNLNNVDITSSLTSLLAGKLSTSLKGQANGLAELDQNGHILSSQLPSSVDEIIEITSLSGTGETGKIYVNTTDNKTYRWSGSQFVEISASLALGETGTTAFRGDHGKTAYEHSLIATGNPHGTKLTDLSDYSSIIGGINTQIEAKANADGSNASGTWGISITGSSRSLNGSTGTALKVGSSTQPVYFNNGIPTAIGYTIQSSVPANAKFTDTTYTLASFGITTNATHLNYTSDVTSNIQAQLNGKAASNAAFHVGTTQITLGRGSAAQTLTGVNIDGSAARLTTARNIALTGAVTGSANFDGSGNITINTTSAGGGRIYKGYQSYRFTAATSSYTITNYSQFVNPDIEVYYNGFLLLPGATSDANREYNLSNGVITFPQALGGTGTEQELVVVIRSLSSAGGLT